MILANWIKNISFYLIFLVGVLIVSSCNTVYFPTNVNSPYLRDKKELKITGTGGVNGVEGQVGYAITDNIGAIGSFSHIQRDGIVRDDIRKEHQSIELGGGYFNKFKKHGSFETYLGYGNGYGRKDDHGYELLYGFPVAAEERNDYARFNKFFIQTGVGISTKHLDLGFTLRANYLSIYKYFDQESGQMIVNRPIQALFFEPAFTIAAGTPFVKFYFQSNLSFTFHYDYYEYYQPAFFNVYFGVRLTLFKKN